MRFVLRGVFVLVILGALTLLGFAIFSDLPAPTREVTLPVETE